MSLLTAGTRVSADVLVLGGGPAGLAAAWHAAKAGRSVVLLERGAAMGGMAASFEIAGVRVDHGSHRLHPDMPGAVSVLLQDLLGTDLQRRPRRGRIRLASRWLAFPLQPVDLARRLPISLVMGAAGDMLASPLRQRHARKNPPATFLQALEAGVGPTVARAFYTPYARKIWGVPPEELDAELARRRVSANSAASLARRVLRGARTSSRVFLYPRLGFGQLTDRLAEAASVHGAELRVNSAPSRLVAPTGGPFLAVLPGGREVEAQSLISTIPAGALLRVLDPSPPADVVADVARLGHRGVVLVYLLLATGQYTPYDAHYLPDERHPVARLSEPRNYRDGPDPQDRTVLCAEIPATPGDQWWTATTEHLGSVVSDAMARSGLPRIPTEHVEVRRLPNVYPIYLRGYASAQTRLEGWAADRTGVLLVGRQPLFAHDNTHHGLTMGIAAAGCIGPAGRVDHDRWRRRREEFRTHHVED